MRQAALAWHWAALAWHWAALASKPHGAGVRQAALPMAVYGSAVVSASVVVGLGAVASVAYGKAACSLHPVPCCQQRFVSCVLLSVPLLPLSVPLLVFVCSQRYALEHRLKVLDDVCRRKEVAHDPCLEATNAVATPSNALHRAGLMTLAPHAER